MGKPRKAVTSKLELIRASSSYGNARRWLGGPFLGLGLLAIINCVVQVITIHWIDAMNSALIAFFCFGVMALAGAVFDMADCAVLAELRAKAREAREARENYRGTEFE